LSQLSSAVLFPVLRLLRQRPGVRRRLHEQPRTARASVRLASVCTHAVNGAGRPFTIFIVSRLPVMTGPRSRTMYCSSSNRSGR
jgi:hypothetical protein